MIELDQLLDGNPTPDEVSEFFKEGEFYEEHYLVDAIKKHLRTDGHKQTLFDLDFSIEDMLNGRVEGHGDVVQDIFSDWNAQLGHNHFGY